MWYKKVDADSNSDDTFQNLIGRAGCCDESATELTYTHASTINLGSNNITGLTGTGIGTGGTFTFTTAATTLATLYAGINEAMEDAGYVDVDGPGTIVSGSASAATVTIKTTATLTKLEGSGSDVNLTGA